MTLTTSTTHADLTITATLDTETLRVSYDVDGIWAGDGKWTDRRGGSAVDCGAILVRDDNDATDAVYAALDAGLRAQLAATGLKAEDAYEYMARTNAWYDCGGAEGAVVDENDSDSSLQSLAAEFVSDAAATGVLIDRAEVERYVRARWAEYLAAQPAPAHDDCDTKGARSLTCRACAAHVDVRDCDLCPECGKVPSHYHCGDLRPIPSCC